MGSGPVTLLFTDLVNSTELLARAGDEQAQRVFRAHHRLLKRCVAAHDGEEVKWLGDGMMTVFSSTADAVRCAIAMQQAARRRAAGERLWIRVGLNVGEVRRDESDYFGMTVVIARRLCDRAEAGQILCSALVPGLLAGQPDFSFREGGLVELKGLNSPVSACEVLYQQDHPTALLTHTPFVGRVSELARLTAKLRDTRAGYGGIAMLAGEPGIGKTRLLEELAETARAEGALVLWGRCYEGEAARPYGPFVEALTELAGTAPAETLRADLGRGAAPLARLAPALHERLPDLPEPATLQPDEERVRLLDAIAQLMIVLSSRTPVVLLLDDLHWADAATITMLRHVARFASRGRILIIGAYRDVEVPPQHPLADALGALPRESTYEYISLAGLQRTEVEELLQALADQKVPAALTSAITTETSGNPFFIREVLLHLFEEGKIVRGEGQWVSNPTFERMGIPQSVRQVIQRRLARISPAANALLRAAAGFSASFRFDLAARVADIEGNDALDAIDEGLAAQLLRRSKDPESFDFTHALVRHALYAELSQPRQVRLHRRIAEAMEQVGADRIGAQSGEIAEHYHLSAVLPGAERGAPHAIRAADLAEQSAAFVEVVGYLRMALAVLPASDPRRPRLLARLAIALAWSLAPDEAVTTAGEAAEALASAEGDGAAAGFLADAADAAWMAAFSPHVWSLAEKGLRYAGARRDTTWARLMVYAIERREAQASSPLASPADSAEREAVTALLWTMPSFRHVGQSVFAFMGFRSREDVLARAEHFPLALVFWAGEYRRALPILDETAGAAMERGQIVLAAFCLAVTSWIHLTSGNLEEAVAAHARAVQLQERVGTAPLLEAMIAGAENGLLNVKGESPDLQLARIEARIAADALGNQWTSANLRSVAASLAARLGRVDAALEYLASIMPAIDGAPVSAMNYPSTISNAVTALVLLDRCDHADVIESNLRTKWLEPDFRYPFCDARQTMANLCSVQGRFEEAAEWFARARVVLDEQGARVPRAWNDLAEAQMWSRRGAAGDDQRTAVLLAAAIEQFRAIGMPGWTRRAEELRARSLEPESDSSSRPSAIADEAPTVPPPRETVAEHIAVAALHREGDYWTLVYGEATSRLKDTKGLRYLSALLRHPGKEFHALELIRLEAPGSSWDAPVDDGLEVLDPQAKAAYRRRLTELRGEIDDADACNDLGRAERARSELETLTQRLAEAVGLGGRDRRTSSATERARSTVTQRIRSAIQKIGEGHPTLADGLSRRVRTGTVCVYEPDLTHPIRWDL